MPVPSWRDIRLPAGAVQTKWPVLLGIGLVSAILLSLIMSGDPVIEQVDPLAVDQEPLEDQEVLAPSAARVSQIERDARLARARQDEEARAAEQAAERARREAAEQARLNAVALQRAQERLRVLRSRGVAQQADAPPTAAVDPAQLVARTADEANMMETLRLEDLARQIGALRAPAVVSSARGYGDRSHQVAIVPPVMAMTRAPASRAAPPPVVPPQPLPDRLQNAGPPPFPEVVEPPLPSAQERLLGAPRLGGTGRFQRPSAGAQPSGAGVAPPVAAFDSGPAASLDAPTGVIVTPRDGDADRLYEGHLIPAVLQTQIDGDIPGPISAQVTRHVYSADRQRVLIPRGTVALGHSTGVTDLWQGRLAVSFHRLIFPDGSWLRLEFTGLNSIGETSLKDAVDRHYLQLFGVAGALGALAGFSRGGSSDSYGSAASEQISASAVQIISQFLNRLPTITIRAGHRLNIRLMSDVVIPRHLSSTVE